MMPARLLLAPAIGHNSSARERGCDDIEGKTASQECSLTALAVKLITFVRFNLLLVLWTGPGHINRFMKLWPVSRTVAYQRVTTIAYPDVYLIIHYRASRCE